MFRYEGFNARVSSQINALLGEHCIIKGEKGTIKVPFFHMASKAVLKTKDEKEVFKDKNKKFATQFKVVSEYIKGEKADALVSLDSSLAVMKLMDEIRKQIGVIFPCDQSFNKK